jgi:F0F1-type ATP synthase membrane subunit b/b'
MTFSVTFFLNGGLFDFDLTFLAEASLFLFLSLIVTFVFLGPISKELDSRAEFIDLTLIKSKVILGSAYKRLSNCVGLLTDEINELNRQVKLTKNYTNSNFEDEINFVQKENSKLLSELKGELSIKSAYAFSNINNELVQITDKFFIKRFKSIS